MTMTGISDAQLTRLITRKRATGRLVVLSTARHSFPTTYTTDDIARLIETDTAHRHLSGPATKHLFERMYHVYSDERFVRLQNISSSHIYNLRETRQYQSQTMHFTKTNPVNIPIGVRKKPRPNGKPGFLRIDTVHQGDLDKVKGVYHINVVDEVTQWEIVGCVEKISEIYLAPLLEALLEQFPFVIIGFHSDCGSEFINYRVAEMLQRMLVKQTKSRARHCGDNGLVEGKNGAVIRKYFGHGHIPRKYAELINEFYQTQMNPYLNFHRPCGFATHLTAANGRVTKKYDTYLTPFEKFKSLENPKHYLKETTDLQCLDIL
ncbi:MAG: integrase [Candidatus Tectomicrobia bacterium]|nr:integrase [Candidatus Tectomicrobia bacterium]